MSWNIDPPKDTEIGKEYVAGYDNPGGWKIDYVISGGKEIDLYMKKFETATANHAEWHPGVIKQSADEKEEWVLGIHTDLVDAPSELNGRKKPVTLSTSGGGGPTSTRAKTKNTSPLVK
ncbi:MAG: hypothetical protein IPJ85_08025 [Flavobacteriales bacterium]|nr:hypothetical protein [Flavobacteriales bacterium]